MKLNLKPFFAIIASAFVLASCVANYVTRYDVETVKNLAYLKPEIKIVYVSYKNDEFDLERVSNVKLSIEKIVEYEKWKGIANKDTYDMVKILSNMYDRHFEERMRSGKWSDIHSSNKLSNMLQLIDKIIKAENFKNR